MPLLIRVQEALEVAQTQSRRRQVGLVVVLAAICARSLFPRPRATAIRLVQVVQVERLQAALLGIKRAATVLLVSLSSLRISLAVTSPAVARQQLISSRNGLMRRTSRASAERQRRLRLTYLRLR